MILDLNNVKNIIQINEKIHISDELLLKSEIQKVKYLKVKGTINEKLLLEAKVNGIVILNDKNLAEIKYPFELEITEELAKYLKNNKKILDLSEIIWENILLEIPIRIIAEESEFKKINDDWQFISNLKEEEGVI